MTSKSQLSIKYSNLQGLCFRYFCSDWKFLAMVYGLNSATGKYFCIWCFCTKAKICDFSSKL